MNERVVSLAAHQAGVIVGTNGRTHGRVRSAGLEYIGTVYAREPVLIVAGGSEQAQFWASEMAFDRDEFKVLRQGFTTGEISQLPTFSEAFFVGTWEKHDAHSMSVLVRGIEMLERPMTFVCSPQGEIIERRVEWCRWVALPKKHHTKWHVFEEDVKGDFYPTLCGAGISRQGAQAAPLFERIERWGPPADACRACAWRVEGWPIGTPQMRAALEAASKWAVSALHAQVAMGDATRFTTHAVDQLKGYLVDLPDKF